MHVVHLPEGFSIERARRAQQLIAQRVVESDQIDYPIRYAAGVDVSFKGQIAVGAAAVVEYPSLSLVEEKAALMRTTVPYVPTLLAFREMGPALMALKKLSHDYQVLFVDGNGRLHPYRAGFACQLGLAVGKPTIGVAKSLLIGEARWLDDVAEVSVGGEVLGYAVKLGPRPIYVSVGHKISLATALRLARAFTRPGARLPEPLLQAHKISVKMRKSITC
ncbi:MAG: endonuclease V [Thermofilum sp.]